MADTTTCAICERAIPADSPGGVCLRCTPTVHDATPAGDRVPAAAEIATKIPGFEILDVLGRGGMGVVFKARQTALERVVAIKVLSPSVASAPGFAERFRREAKAMARLSHPNIVAVHEYGVAGDLPYLVLEFVDGVDVRKAMANGRVRARDALAIVPQICDALQYAHDRGVVHRDIKPENVLIGRDGRVRIADFGLAKLAIGTKGEPSLTLTGQVMGTLRYMAPEQWERPDDVDHRADIYGLGVLFYEMLTGDLPVGRFEPPSQRSGSDARLDDVVLRSLERDRDRRWQRAEDVKAKLAEIGAAAGVALPPSRPAQALPNPTVASDVSEEQDAGVYAQYMAAVAPSGSLEGRVEFHSGDMTAMPFRDASLEKLVASLSGHNVEDGERRSRAVREITRVLQPGGSVALFDFRQGPEFAEALRACGMEQVEISPVSTWSSLPVRVVTARRSSSRS